MIHGGFDGGWVWAEIGQQIRQAGHLFYSPTLTGSGERVHLASPEVSLETYVTDIVNVLEFEDLHEVVLVAHSSGGVVATGVTEQASQRIKHVVYLDSKVPRNGESSFDVLRAGSAELLLRIG